MGEGYRAYADVTTVAGAPTVDLYEDFQCPNCGQFEAILGSTVKDLAQQGKIVLKYHVMNFLDDKGGIQNSTPAGNGAFCAAEDGKFPEFHDAVYAAQVPEGTDVSQAALDGWAKTAGITGDALHDVELVRRRAASTRATSARSTTRPSRSRSSRAPRR